MIAVMPVWLSQSIQKDVNNDPWELASHLLGAPREPRKMMDAFGLAEKRREGTR